MLLHERPAAPPARAPGKTGVFVAAAPLTTFEEQGGTQFIAFEGCAHKVQASGLARRCERSLVGS